LLKSFSSCRRPLIVVAAAVVVVVVSDIYEACILQYKKHLCYIYVHNYGSSGSGM
jgi:tRNA splicing ligase